jgi:aerobic carbon-monoxide dehydrogenase medium subunit
MQVPGPFEYERATSVDHAVGLLDRLGEGALIVAGGHSLLPMMKLRIANPEYLVDINDLAVELGYIAVGGVSSPLLARLGAMTRHRAILDSDPLAAACPIFRDAERVIADPVVRNRGTVGGSLCQADPAEDLTTVCGVLDAICLARGPSGEREIPIDEFLEGPYETSLAHNEMLIEVRIPLRHNTSNAYAKVERRVGDWAVTAAGAQVTLDGDSIVAARIGLTAVNSDAQALAAASAALVGKPATEDTFSAAGAEAAQACEPVSDMRGSADYKRHLAAELTVRTLRTAVQRVRDNADPQGN